MRGYIPLIQNAYMHGPAVYVKGGFHFAHDISLENSADYLSF